MILDTYTDNTLLGKLLEECSTNTCEAGNSLLWRVYLSKNNFRPRTGPMQVQRAMLVRSVGGEYELQNRMDVELGLGTSEGTKIVRGKKTKQRAKKIEAAKTVEGKKAKASAKNEREMSTKTKKSDNGHNQNNHVKQDGGKKSKCTVCQRTECPRTRKKPCEYKKEYSRPSCPDPTKPLGDATVVFLDSEFQHYPDTIGGRKRRTIMEIGAVAAKPDSKKRKWERVGDEFDQPIRVKRFNMKLIGIMKQEKMKERCIKGGVDVKDGFQNLLTYLKGLPGDSKVFKGHNFIPSDMRHMFEHLKHAGVEDPINDLEEAGIAGIADGMRFIPKHKELSHLRVRRRTRRQAI